MVLKPAALVLWALVSVSCTRAEPPRPRASPVPPSAAPAPVASPASSAPSAATRQRQASPSRDAGAPYGDVIRKICAAIERLRPSYPQLAEFSTDRHCDTERLVVSYDYHTVLGSRRAGWAGGVPNPTPDGVWFQIDFYDPGSQAQIHTQPMTPRMRFRDKHVMLLVLNGEATRPINGSLRDILDGVGVKPDGLRD